MLNRILLLKYFIILSDYSQNFRINKECAHRNYVNSYELSLTAFVGHPENVQLTVHTRSTVDGQSGIGYIELSDEDMDNIIAGFMERKLRHVTATGAEQSKFKPDRDV